MADVTATLNRIGSELLSYLATDAVRDGRRAVRSLWEFIFPNPIDRRLDELAELSGSNSFASSEMRGTIRAAQQEGEYLKSERATHPSRDVDVLISAWLAETDHLMNGARRWSLFLTFAILGIAFVIVTSLAEIATMLGFGSLQPSLTDLATTITDVFIAPNSPEFANVARTVRTALMLAFIAAAIGSIAILFFGSPRSRWAYVAAMMAAAGPIAAVSAIGFHIAHQANHVRSQETRYAITVDRLRNALQKKEQAQATLADMQTQSEEVDAEIESLKTLIAALRLPAKFAEAQDAAKSRITILNQKIAIREEHKRDLEEQIRAATGKLALPKQRLEKVDGELTKARSERDAHMNGKDTEEYRRLDNTWRKLAGEQRSLEAKTGAIEATIRTLKDSLRAANRSIANINHETETLDAIAQYTGKEPKGVEIANLIERKNAKIREQARIRSEVVALSKMTASAATEWEAATQEKSVSDSELETARIDYVKSWGMDVDMPSALSDGSSLARTPLDTPTASLQSGYAQFLKVVADFVGANEFRMYFAVIFLVLSFPWVVGMIIVLPKQIKIVGVFLLLWAAF
jgi:hypothetical protein